MKSICLLAIIPLLLTGCNKPDPKTAILEKRINVLADMVRHLQDRADELGTNEILDYRWLSAVSAVQTNNSARISGLEQIYSSDGIIDPATGLPAPISMSVYELQNTVTNLIASLNQSGATKHISFRSGQMPADIAAQIRAAALSKWPGEYDMQVYEIKKQAEAWRTLHP